MKLNKVIYLLFLMILVLGFTVINPINSGIQEIDVVAVHNKTDYIAGDEIVLKFKTNKRIEANLLLESSYCKTHLNSQQQDEMLIFKIPSSISEKKGVLHYKLIFNTKELHSGRLNIKASDKIKTPLESYLGPTSIIAGGIDYGMITVLPSDVFDNPIEDSTLISIKHQFLETEKNSEFYTKDFIVWNNIYSYEKSGRILVSAHTAKTASKEFTLDVFPAQAQDFDLYTSKKHEYADGNQIIEFSTSIIKDAYGNVISDGRLVEFSIVTANQERLRTTGTSINGVATGYMVHPVSETTWDIQAFIPEMAQSNKLTMTFKSSVKDYEIQFSKTNRKITVGPILSFMNQIIPDGAIISLSIENDNKMIDTLSEFSSEGFVEFNMSEDFFPNGKYTVEINGMGITKKYDRIELK
ncbi:hypothetical protein [Aquimarina sp. SS2-1]|uniref:hypothetical protein n=1 Tax=Aquimarina besae TaxID=3342247 RepID=UPI00366B9CD9